MNDEDWSIISSSSDMDEEQTPGSSREVISDGELQRNREMSFSSVGTLKVPLMETPQRRNSSEKGDIVGGKLESQKPISETSGDISSSDKFRVKKAVNFYESLSSLNDSIKQRSTDFYENVARFRLQQLQRYMSPTIDLAQEPIIESVINEEEDTDSVCTDSTENSSISSTKPDPGTTPITGPLFNFGRTLAVQTSLVVDEFLDIVENNSEYLLYYLIMLVLGVFSVAYFRYNVTTLPPKIEQPRSLYEDYYQQTKDMVESFIYEPKQESGSKYLNFWKQSPNGKQLKLSKYWKYTEKRIQEITIPNISSSITEFKKFMNTRIPQETYRRLSFVIVNARSSFQSNLSRFIDSAHHTVIVGKRSTLDAYKSVQYSAQRLISSEWHSLESSVDFNKYFLKMKTGKDHLDNAAVFVYRRSSPLRSFVKKFTDYSFQVV